MKLLKVFALFIVLHGTAWAGAHFYLSKNKPEVLVVVDTSYSMKTKFTEVGKWIDNFESSSRYKTVVVGTDKALLGELSSLKSQSVIFRTAFGRMTDASLDLYSQNPAKERILLSDGTVKPKGWKVISF